jgi:hypothetical protein
MKIFAKLIEVTFSPIAAVVSAHWHCRRLDEVERLTFMNLHGQRAARRKRNTVADVRTDLEEAKRRVAQMRLHPKTGRKVAEENRVIAHFDQEDKRY